MSKTQRIEALEREVAELRGLVNELFGYRVDEWYGRVKRLEGLTGHPFERPAVLPPAAAPVDDRGEAAQVRYFGYPGAVLIGGDRDR